MAGGIAESFTAWLGSILERLIREWFFMSTDSSVVSATHCLKGNRLRLSGYLQYSVFCLKSYYIYSVFNINELLCSVVGVGHARNNLTTIAESTIIRGYGQFLRVVSRWR